MAGIHGAWPSVIRNRREWGADFGLSAAFKALEPLFQENYHKIYTAYFDSVPNNSDGTRWKTGSDRIGDYYNRGDEILTDSGYPRAAIRGILLPLGKIGKYHASTLSEVFGTTIASQRRYRANTYNSDYLDSIAYDPVAPSMKAMSLMDKWFTYLGKNLSINPGLMKKAFVTLLQSSRDYYGNVQTHKNPNCHGNGPFLYGQMMMSIPDVWGVESEIPYNKGADQENGYGNVYAGDILTGIPYSGEKRTMRKSKKRRSKRKKYN